MALLLLLSLVHVFMVLTVDPYALRAIVTARETQAFVGSEVAVVKGEGIEYADIRDFVPGDRVRSINWRATGDGELVVLRAQLIPVPLPGV